MARKSKRAPVARKRQAAQPKRRSGDPSAELKEALEQQAAVSGILRVISQSPADVQPVLATIAEHAMRLCRARDARIWLLEGDQVRYATGCGDIPPAREGHTLPINRESGPGLAILDRKPVHIGDASIVPEDEFPFVREMQRLHGHRTVLIVPLLREDQALGVIVLRKMVVQPFTKSQIALVRTFADQAVIAIENVRLFNETKEALEQQTATSEILAAMSASTTDTKPVFDAIVRSCHSLFKGSGVALRLVRNDMLHVDANIGYDAATIPVDRESATGVCVLEARAIHVPDIEAAAAEFPRVRQLGLRFGYRSGIYAPLLRHGAAIGTISVLRPKPGAFSDKEIALLKTFADQAVIAIENVRLFKELQARNRELTRLLEQQTATSDILGVISRSPTDVTPVFETILKKAADLCGSPMAAIFRFDGQLLHIEGTYNWPSEALASLTRFPSPPNPALISGRVILSKSPVREADVLSDPGYDHGLAVTGTWRRMLGVPLLRDGEPIGVINLGWPEAGETPEYQVELLKTFASQAVIAIENVRLFKELQARNAEISEALEQQTATSEILRVISSSPTDTQPVFEAVTRSAARLCGAEDVVIRLLDGDVHHGIAHHGPIPMVGPLTLHGSIAGHAMLNRKSVQIEDLLEPSVRAEFREADATAEGYRTFLAAPLVREDIAVGAIVMRREQVSPFTDKQIALLETFAAQAVIAIENVRLFKELQARNAQVTEALEQQTSIAEILRVISSTPTDIMPVIDAVTHRAAQLCDAPDARLFLVDGGTLRHVAGFGEFRGVPQTLPLTRGVVTGRAILDQAVVHIEDLSATLDEFPDARGPQREFGARTTLAVPLVRENKAFGGIVMRRREVRPFTDKQIELVKTFADQATIALENVRLFNEIQDKSRELEVANKHKSEFLASMSHELRTPLNAIIGFSEALLEKMFGEMNAKQEDYLKDIHSSGEHLLSLINDILDLSKIEAGRMELELSDFSLPAALQNAMTLVRERAQNHGIALEFHVDPQLGEIRADERKFKQIVLNLLSNAVKFTPNGGCVQVDARMNGNSVQVSVKDTGVGIAEKDGEAVFEEFRQVGHDYTTKHEGTGLGLALTRRFVELHGGRISLESEPGKGSTFTFTLPLSRPN